MKNGLSKFAVSSGLEVILKDERKGFDHNQNFVHLEYIGYNDNNKSKESDKFWQGWTEGNNFCVRFGARGSKGTIGKPKPMGSPYLAKSALDKKTREKLREGYKIAGT